MAIDITGLFGPSGGAGAFPLVNADDIQFDAGAEVTLDTNGDFTQPASFHFTLDTFADAASGNVRNITRDANAPALIVFRPANDARTIVVGHDAAGGNISCVGQADITLDDIEDWCLLLYDSVATRWYAMSAVGGGGGGPVAHADTTGQTVDDHHTEDHNHDGAPTQQLLAANTHDTPAADTHHAKYTDAEAVTAGTDDATSDPLITGAAAADGTEGSFARKDHVHPYHASHGVTHNAVHGISKHTEHATWKVLYTDGAGDEQELALGAADTVLRSAGVGAAPTMSVMKVSKSVIFSSPNADLAVEDWLPDQAVRVPAASKHGTWTPGTVYVRVGTVGTGTNTILFRTSSTLTGARTTRATVNLGTSQEASAAITWTPADGEYMWIECSAVGGTAPIAGIAQVDLLEALVS